MTVPIATEFSSNKRIQKSEHNPNPSSLRSTATEARRRRHTPGNHKPAAPPGEKNSRNGYSPSLRRITPHPRHCSSPIQELVPSGAFAFCNPPEPDLKEIVKIILRKVLKLPEEEEGLPTPPPSSPPPLPPAPATSPPESWIAFSGGFALGFSTGTWFGYWLGKKKRVQPQKQGLLCIYSPPSSVLHRRISTDAHLYTI